MTHGRANASNMATVNRLLSNTGSQKVRLRPTRELVEDLMSGKRKVYGNVSLQNHSLNKHRSTLHNRIVGCREEDLELAVHTRPDSDKEAIFCFIWRSVQALRTGRVWQIPAENLGGVQS